MSVDPTPGGRLMLPFLRPLDVLDQRQDVLLQVFCHFFLLKARLIFIQDVVGSFPGVVCVASLACCLCVIFICTCLSLFFVFFSLFLLAALSTCVVEEAVAVDVVNEFRLLDDFKDCFPSLFVFFRQ